MSEFPLLFTVGHRVWSEDGEDAHGNPIAGWSTPVTKPVYGWGAPSGDEPKIAGVDRVEVEVELLVPPEFQCDRKDRIVLDGDEFEVVGPMEMFDHNPFGWNPGGVVNLRSVT